MRKSQHSVRLLTGSTVGMFAVLLLLRLDEEVGADWLSSKSPPLTLLDGEVALLRLEPMAKVKLEVPG